MKQAVQGVGPEATPFPESALPKSESETTVDVINPSNGQRVFSIPTGCDADADRAVTAARAAFEDGRWSDAPPSHRKKTLHRLADLIGAESAALDRLDAEEMGKPVSTTAANAAAAAELMRFYAEAIDKVMGAFYSSGRSSMAAQRQVPRGVVAAVTPWNFPTVNAVRKLAPSLAAGNSVVLKPSELSSRSAIRLGQLALQAGLPADVLSVIPGLGETVGRALGLHGDVDMITFTGSTDVGKAMLGYAGQSNMKVVLAECGGKSPHIVFDDGVDLNAAGETIARSMLTNQGQVCSVGSRLLVQRSAEAALVERIAACMQRAVIGNALNSRTTFGPLVSARQCERVMRYIEGAQRDGAELVTGGRRVLRETGGYFVEPTVFRNVAPAARIAQEEIFGPVLSVIPFDDEAEAIRIANGTIYGLVAYIWTASLSTGMRMAKRIRSAAIVNAAAPAAEDPGHVLSSEPARQSGVGIETGLSGLESYTRRQLVVINHG